VIWYEPAQSVFIRSRTTVGVLGLNHPQTTTSLNNLALVLRDQGDLAGARTLHERALAIRETHLGPDHPATEESRRELVAVVTALEHRS
jgi:hypothetical protein